MEDNASAATAVSTKSNQIPNIGAKKEEPAVAVDQAYSPATASDIKVEEPQYASGARLVLIMLTIFLSTLLTALEIGIIATAIPALTDTFHRIDDVGWYGSATFILAGAGAPLWGKIYKYLDIKSVFLSSIIFYTVGSIVGATASNSVAVIVGRALQGLGGGGTLSGSVLVIHLVSRPQIKPIMMGMYSSPIDSSAL